MMKMLEVLAIYVVPFLALGLLVRRYLTRRIDDVDISNVRGQADTPGRPRRVSFFGRIRD